MVSQNDEIETTVEKKRDVIIEIIGMAGSGKSKLAESLFLNCRDVGIKTHMVNLDPAVLEVGYPIDNDIQDTIKYKDIMKKHDLGPNGAIMLAMKLFVLSSDNFIKQIEEFFGRDQFSDIDKDSDSDSEMLIDIDKHIDSEEDVFDRRVAIIDTPGQLEVFTTSTAGKTISDLMKTIRSTIMLYVMDVKANTNAMTFISNMLYACSVMLKFQVKIIMVLNKSDLGGAKKVEAWFSDMDDLREAANSEGDYTSSYISSAVLLLEEFYNHLDFISVSSHTGQGICELIEMIYDKSGMLANKQDIDGIVEDLEDLST